MISDITLQKQTHIVGAGYEPNQPCACGTCDHTTQKLPCNPGDWYYADRICCDGCPTLAQCSRVQSDLCPGIGGIPPIPGIATFPTNKLIPVSEASGIQCSYPISQIKSSEDINTWIKSFGKTKTFNTSIMPYWCTQQVSTCTNSSSSCSRFLSSNTTEAGLCSDWAKANPDLYDSTISKYCSPTLTSAYGTGISSTFLGRTFEHGALTASGECICVNRMNDPLYTSIGPIPGLADGCWYTPCSDPTVTLVPT